MDWLSNSWWIFLAPALCVVILAALFAGRRGRSPGEGGGECCGGMGHDKREGQPPASHAHR